MKTVPVNYPYKPEVVLGDVPEINVPEIEVSYHRDKNKVFGGKVTSSPDVAKFLRSIIPEGEMELQEQFVVLYLNRNNVIIGYYRHAKGGIDGVVADIRIILSVALKAVASSIVLCHNHPSGNTKFSEQDITITKNFKEACRILNLKLIDHIVLTKETYSSCADEGLLGLGIDLGRLGVNEGEEAAKELIRSYVKRGDSCQSLRAGQMGSYNREFSASIKGDKIHVVAIKDKKVDFKFPLQRIYNDLKAETGKIVPKPSTNPAADRPNHVRITSKNAKPVERIEEELRFIKRFVLLHGKKKTKEQILNFINALQKAILERRIRKTSPYASEINSIQKQLVLSYKKMRASETFYLTKEAVDKLGVIAGSKKVRLSIQYLKRFIGIHGKNITKEKAVALLDLISNAFEKGSIQKSDPYFDRIKQVVISLQRFSKVARKGETVEVHEAVLNGLNEAFLGCSCQENKELDGVEEYAVESQTEHEPEPKEDAVPKRTILNSLDVIKLKSNKIGFSGKWLTFIGNPSKGFTIMIYGKPKYGKSILATDLAGYLARNHGKVLYIAMEEGFDDTLKERLESADVAHPNLDVADYMVDPIKKEYDFIFIDSVNRAGLSAKDLEDLEKKYPGKSFVYVFQTTKDGDFRGGMEFKHNVDVIIEVPELGQATQYGRFNQGGNLKIFGDGVVKETEELNGVGKKKIEISNEIPPKKNKSRFPDWTEPKDLDEHDWKKLKIIKKYYDEGEYGMAMEYAMYNADTEIREAIPPNIWLEIGGSLTATGKEKLRLLLLKYPEK